MMKKFLLITILLLLNIFIVYGLNDISVKITPLKNSVTPIQNATYSVSLNNNLDKDLTFEFRYLDVDWRLNPEKIMVPAYSNKNIVLTLVPQSPYSDQKSKYVRVIVTTNDESYRQDFLLDIDVLKYKEIFDQSDSNLIVPDPVDPRKPTVIYLKLINTKDASLDEVEVKLTSPFFDQKKTISISPLESTTLDFPVDLSDKTKFGSYPIVALVTFKDKILANFSKQMKIGNYPNVLEQESPKSGFLLDILEITKKNDGNSVSHEVITKKLTTFQKFFTKTSPPPTSQEKKDGYLYIWSIDLQPGESKTIVIETNYRWFFILIVIIAFLLITIYLVTKRDIIIKKKLVSIKKENDGTSTIKISISIKNKGLNKIRNVKVMDRIPKIIGMPHEFGSAHPKTVETPQGMQLLWEIITLNPQEERIFSYKAISKLQIIGKATIPSAIVKYTKGNRSLMVYSNPEQLLS